MVRESQLTPAQKVLLAVSLPVTLVFMYFLLRKNNDEDEEEGGESKTGASRFSIVEVNVPPDAVGAVIGPQGSQIKSIQEATKTRINFKGDRSTDKDRVLVIRGTREGIHQAELMVRKIIVDQPPMTADVISVPCETIGRIIGRNGDTIRTLSRLSKAKITIEQTESRVKANSTGTIHLKGTQAAIDSAKSMIMEKIAEELEFRAKKKVQENSNAASTVNNAAESEDIVQLGVEYKPVYVSAVEHPEHFWLQVLSKKSAQLDKLVEEMTDFYGTQNLGEAVQEIRAGDIVAAPFEHDSQWYRTEVVALEEDSVDLYYRDFGDSSFVNKNSIRILKKEFAGLPFQAVECCLADVKPTPGLEWTSEAVDVFEVLSHTAKWKPVMCRVVGTKTTSFGVVIPCVELVDTNGTKDINIAEELVKQGHATRSGDGSDNLPLSCDEIGDLELFQWDKTRSEWFLEDSFRDGVDRFDVSFLQHALRTTSLGDIGHADLKNACVRLSREMASCARFSVPSNDEHCLYSKTSDSKPAGLYEGYCDQLDDYADDVVSTVDNLVSLSRGIEKILNKICAKKTLRGRNRATAEPFKKSSWSDIIHTPRLPADVMPAHQKNVSVSQGGTESGIIQDEEDSFTPVVTKRQKRRQRQRQQSEAEESIVDEQLVAALQATGDSLSDVSLSETVKNVSVDEVSDVQLGTSLQPAAVESLSVVDSLTTHASGQSTEGSHCNTAKAAVDADDGKAAVELICVSNASDASIDESKLALSIEDCVDNQFRSQLVDLARCHLAEADRMINYYQHLTKLNDLERGKLCNSGLGHVNGAVDKVVITHQVITDLCPQTSTDISSNTITVGPGCPSLLPTDESNCWPAPVDKQLSSLSDVTNESLLDPELRIPTNDVKVGAVEMQLSDSVEPGVENEDNCFTPVVSRKSRRRQRQRQLSELSDDLAMAVEGQVIEPTDPSCRSEECSPDSVIQLQTVASLKSDSVLDSATSNKNVHESTNKTAQPTEEATADGTNQKIGLSTVDTTCSTESYDAHSELLVGIADGYPAVQQIRQLNTIRRDLRVEPNGTTAATLGDDASSQLDLAFPSVQESLEVYRRLNGLNFVDAEAVSSVALSSGVIASESDIEPHLVTTHNSGSFKFETKIPAATSNLSTELVTKHIDEGNSTPKSANLSDFFNLDVRTLLYSYGTFDALRDLETGKFWRKHAGMSELISIDCDSAPGGSNEGKLCRLDELPTKENESKLSGKIKEPGLASFTSEIPEAEVNSTQYSIDTSVMMGDGSGVTDLLSAEKVLPSTEDEITKDDDLFKPVVGKKHKRRQRQRQLSEESPVDGPFMLTRDTTQVEKCSETTPLPIIKYIWNVDTGGSTLDTAEGDDTDSRAVAQEKVCADSVNISQCDKQEIISDLGANKSCPVSVHQSQSVLTNNSSKVQAEKEIESVAGKQCLLRDVESSCTVLFENDLAFSSAHFVSLRILSSLEAGNLVPISRVNVNENEEKTACTKAVNSIKNDPEQEQRQAIVRKCVVEELSDSKLSAGSSETLSVEVQSSAFDTSSDLKVPRQMRFNSLEEDEHMYSYCAFVALRDVETGRSMTYAPKESRFEYVPAVKGVSDVGEVPNQVALDKKPAHVISEVDAARTTDCIQVESYAAPLDDTSPAHLACEAVEEDDSFTPVVSKRQKRRQRQLSEESISDVPCHAQNDEDSPLDMKHNESCLTTYKTIPEVGEEVGGPRRGTEESFIDKLNPTMDLMAEAARLPVASILTTENVSSSAANDVTDGYPTLHYVLELNEVRSKLSPDMNGAGYEALSQLALKYPTVQESLGVYRRVSGSDQGRGECVNSKVDVNVTQSLSLESLKADSTEQTTSGFSGGLQKAEAQSIQTVTSCSNANNDYLEKASHLYVYSGLVTLRDFESGSFHKTSVEMTNAGYDGSNEGRLNEMSSEINSMSAKTSASISDAIETNVAGMLPVSPNLNSVKAEAVKDADDKAYGTDILDSEPNSRSATNSEKLNSCIESEYPYFNALITLQAIESGKKTANDRLLSSQMNLDKRIPEIVEGSPKPATDSKYLPMTAPKQSLSPAIDSSVSNISIRKCAIGENEVKEISKFTPTSKLAINVPLLSTYKPVETTPESAAFSNSKHDGAAVESNNVTLNADSALPTANEIDKLKLSTKNCKIDEDFDKCKSVSSICEPESCLAGVDTSEESSHLLPPEEETLQAPEFLENENVENFISLNVSWIEANQVAKTEAGRSSASKALLECSNLGVEKLKEEVGFKSDQPICQAKRKGNRAQKQADKNSSLQITSLTSDQKDQVVSKFTEESPQVCCKLPQGVSINVNDVSRNNSTTKIAEERLREVEQRTNGSKDEVESNIETVKLETVSQGISTVQLSVSGNVTPSNAKKRKNRHKKKNTYSNPDQDGATGDTSVLLSPLSFAEPDSHSHLNVEMSEIGIPVDHVSRSTEETISRIESDETSGTQSVSTDVIVVSGTAAVGNHTTEESESSCNRNLMSGAGSKSKTNIPPQDRSDVRDENGSEQIQTKSRAGSAKFQPSCISDDGHAQLPGISEEIDTRKICDGKREQKMCSMNEQPLQDNGPAIQDKMSSSGFTGQRKPDQGSCELEIKPIRDREADDRPEVRDVKISNCSSSHLLDGLSMGAECQASRTRKRNKRKRAKRKSYLDDHESETDLSSLLSQIAAVCSMNNANFPASSAQQVAETSEINQSGVGIDATKARRQKTYTRSKACKLPPADIFDENVESKKASDDTERTKAMLYGAEQPLDTSVDGAVKQSDTNDSLPAAVKVPLPDHAKSRTKTKTGSETVHDVLSQDQPVSGLRCCDSMEHHRNLASSKESIGFKASSAGDVFGHEAKFDRCADSEVEKIFAIRQQGGNSHPTCCVGSKKINSEFQNIKETETVVESIYGENSMPLSTVCDGSSSQPFHSESNSSQEFYIARHTVSNQPLQQAADYKSKYEAATEEGDNPDQARLIGTTASASDSNDANVSIDFVNAEKQNDDGLFYPQWLGKAGPPRQHLPAGIGGVSRKRLRSRGNADSDEDDDDDDYRRLGYTRRSHNDEFQFMIAQHKPQLTDATRGVSDVVLHGSFALHGETQLTHVEEPFLLHFYDHSPKTIHPQALPTSRELPMHGELSASSQHVIDVRGTNDRGIVDDGLEEEADRQFAASAGDEVRVHAMESRSQNVCRSEHVVSDTIATCASDPLDFGEEQRHTVELAEQPEMSVPREFGNVEPDAATRRDEDCQSSGPHDPSVKGCSSGQARAKPTRGTGSRVGKKGRKK